MRSFLRQAHLAFGAARRWPLVHVGLDSFVDHDRG